MYRALGESRLGSRAHTYFDGSVTVYTMVWQAAQAWGPSEPRAPQVLWHPFCAPPASASAPTPALTHADHTHPQIVTEQYGTILHAAAHARPNPWPGIQWALRQMPDAASEPCWDTNGFTPLHHAVRDGCELAIYALVHAGFDVNQPSMDLIHGEALESLVGSSGPTCTFTVLQQRLYLTLLLVGHGCPISHMPPVYSAALPCRPH